MKIVIRHSRTKMVHTLGVYCRVRVRWWGSFEYDKLVLFKASMFNGSITLWRNTFYNVITVYTRKKRWVKLSSNCRITSQNIGWKNWRDLSVVKSVGGRGLILSKNYVVDLSIVAMFYLSEVVNLPLRLYISFQKTTNLLYETS